MLVRENVSFPFGFHLFEAEIFHVLSAAEGYNIRCHFCSVENFGAVSGSFSKSETL